MADEGNGERWFWLNCTIVEKEPEVEAMLIEPTTDGTGRLLKEYQELQDPSVFGTSARTGNQEGSLGRSF